MHALLTLLEADSRATPEVLARQLDTTPEAVVAQMREFEEKKIILGYRAVIDDEKAGRGTVRAVIEVRVTPERDGGFDRIAARVSKYPEVSACFLMSGGYDLLVFIEGKNLQEVALFVSQKLAAIQGVLSTATHFMLKPYKEHGVVLVGEGKVERLSVTP